MFFSVCSVCSNILSQQWGHPHVRAHTHPHTPTRRLPHTSPHPIIHSETHHTKHMTAWAVTGHCNPDRHADESSATQIQRVSSWSRPALCSSVSTPKPNRWDSFSSKWLQRPCRTGWRLGDICQHTCPSHCTWDKASTAFWEKSIKLNFNNGGGRVIVCCYFASLVPGVIITMTTDWNHKFCSATENSFDFRKTIQNTPGSAQNGSQWLLWSGIVKVWRCCDINLYGFFCCCCCCHVWEPSNETQLKQFSQGRQN